MKVIRNSLLRYPTPSLFVICNLMSRKFFKLLIIGNPKPTILHIQTRGVGGMGRWGDGEMGRWDDMMMRCWGVGVFGIVILHGCMVAWMYV